MKNDTKANALESDDFLERHDKKRVEDQEVEQEKEQPKLSKNNLKAIQLATQALVSPDLREGEEIISVDPALIDRNRFQNRKRFKNIKALADRIQASGQHQPCIVRKVGNRYEMAAGERRWRACEMLGIHIKVIVRDLTNDEMFSICISENEDREETNVVEKYLAIKKMMEDKILQPEIATRFNISVPSVTRVMKLSNLPDDLIERLAGSKLAEKMTFLRADEIGNVFRDMPSKHKELTKLLDVEINLFEHQVFEVESRHEDETNRTIKSFIHKAKQLEKRPSDRPIVEFPVYDLAIDGVAVGQIKTNSKGLNLSINKKDIPADQFDEFIKHVQNFFEKPLEA